MIRGLRAKLNKVILFGGHSKHSWFDDLRDVWSYENLKLCGKRLIIYPDKKKLAYEFPFISFPEKRSYRFASGSKQPVTTFWFNLKSNLATNRAAEALEARISPAPSFTDTTLCLEQRAIDYLIG